MVLNPGNPNLYFKHKLHTKQDKRRKQALHRTHAQLKMSNTVF